MKKILHCDKEYAKHKGIIRYIEVNTEHHIFFIGIWPGMTLQELSDEISQIYRGTEDELVYKICIVKNYLTNW